MSRPFIAQFPLLTNVSMAASVSSSPINIQQMSYVGFDVSWTGTPVGTFSVEVSNTYKQSGEGVVLVAGNWTALTLSAVVSATGTSGNGFIDIDGVSADWIRLTYTRTSGTGSLSATASAKVI